jgi:hypothetical protein
VCGFRLRFFQRAYTLKRFPIVIYFST